MFKNSAAIAVLFLIHLTRPCGIFYLIRGGDHFVPKKNCAGSICCRRRGWAVAGMLMQQRVFRTARMCANHRRIVDRRKISA